MADIFISYAHVDNQPFSGQEKGWITLLFENLSNEVKRKMWRAENYTLWIDFHLKGNDEITPEIETQLQQTKTLVILLSPGWLASTWCQDELKIFRNTHPNINERIFVVELDRITKANKPASLHDLLNYPFWRKTDQDKIRQLGYPVPHSDDTLYYDRLADLSDNLATFLKTDKQAESVWIPKATVYVAPVNDSLYSQRANLISELRQFGVDALPRNNDLDDNMDAALAQCSHFVQLLDSIYAFGVPRKQLAAAEFTGKPILQWRDPKLDVNGIQAEQQKLLEGKTVIAVPLTDFIRMVREAVLPTPKPHVDDRPKPNGKLMVFIHAAPDDFERAQRVADTLQAKGYGINLPCYQGEPERIRKSIERGYQCCDVLLMLHQKATAEVVEDHLSDAQTQVLRREIKPLILMCQCGCAEKLFFIPPGMMILSCCDNFDQHCLEQFLAKVDA